MKVAIVHYWLVKMRGGEKVLEAMCEMFPDADIYTHVYKPEAISPAINKHSVRTTFINKLPFAVKHYQSYLPLMPLALKKIDLSAYDLVISCESGPAKGITVPSATRHVCYCHTPMRYIWDMYEEYRNASSFFTRLVMSLLVPRLRKWDLGTAKGVQTFVANSGFVQQRIKRIYNRESQVIYPPVAIDDFYISHEVGDFYLYAGELTQYKNPQLAIEAFNHSGRKLLVIGEGGMEKSLRAMAEDNIQFLGRQSYERLKYYYSHCRALIFPGIEDFGIIPVEVMASGRPVIAFRDGGALETVVEGESGLFFDEQSIESLNMAISDFEIMSDGFDSKKVKAVAEAYSKQRFKTEFLDVITCN
jgi:glycosyltransferase involved in cell wall biosynthesis